MENNSPADLRALAERVERSQSPNDEIARALGWRMTGDYRGWPPGSSRKEVVPIYYEDLNAIAAAWQPLRERGWIISTMREFQRDTVIGTPEYEWSMAAYNGRRGVGYETSTAPVSHMPRAWLALLLRCMAAEMEAAQ